LQSKELFEAYCMIKNKIHPASIRIAIVFLVIGALWVILSDRLALLLNDNLERLSAIQALKAWPFIGITTLNILFLVNHEITKKKGEISAINLKSEWQRLLISNLPDTKARRKAIIRVKKSHILGVCRFRLHYFYHL
jgi:hypothetical protein